MVDEYAPPTEEEWINESIKQVQLIIKTVGDKIPAVGPVDLTPEIIKILAKARISPYHYHCENHRREWMTTAARAKANGQNKGEDKGKEVPATDKAQSPHGPDKNASTTDQKQTKPLDKNANTGNASGRAGASKIDEELAKVKPPQTQTDLQGKPVKETPWINWPKFRSGIKGDVFAVCPVCNGGMTDKRPDPSDPLSRTVPGPNGTRKPDFVCDDPACTTPKGYQNGIWLKTKEEDEERNGPKRRRK